MLLKMQSFDKFLEQELSELYQGKNSIDEKLQIVGSVLKEPTSHLKEDKQKQAALDRLESTYALKRYYKMPLY